MINLLSNTSSNIGHVAGAAHGHRGASSSDTDSLTDVFDSLLQELTSANAAAGASASTGGGASAAATASATTTANSVSALNQLMQNLKLADSTPATAGTTSASTAQTSGTGPLKMLSMLQHLAQQGAPATLVGVVGGLVNAVA